MKTQSLSLYGAALLFALLLISPFAVHAQGGANAMCMPFFPECPCKMMPNPQKGMPGQPPCIGGANTAGCPVGVCEEQTPKGPVKGTCASPGKCEGKLTAEGKGVGLGQVSQIMQGLQGMMQGLQGMMQGGGGGGGGQQGGQQGGQGGLGSGLGGLTGSSPWTTEACIGTQYDVSYPSTDPCARYTQPTSESLLGGQTGTGSSLLNQLTGGNGTTQTESTGSAGSGLDTVGDQTSASETLLGGATTQATSQNIGTASGSQTAAQTGTSATSTGVAPSGDVAGLMPGGPRGNITADQAGLTITAGSRDVSGNSEVAGFFGASTGNAGLSKSVIGRWCATRPWATNFLGKIVPVAVFDGLCTRAGYVVGEEPASADTDSGDIGRPPVTVLQQKRNPPRATTTPAQATPTGPVPPGRVQIWAVPSSVSLGSRTSVFWATENVTGCTETSSDGNFSQASLSGGASTVPLAGQTTFIISCRDGAGVEIKGSVTVTIKH